MALENSRYMEQFLSKKAHTPGKNMVCDVHSLKHKIAP